MKASTALLIGSLVANVGLAAWVLTRQPADTPAATGVPPAANAAVAVARSLDSATARAAAGEASPGRSPVPLWQRWGAGRDLPALVARLREAGFPANVVRAVITSLVAQQFDPERCRIDAAALATPYWREWRNSYLDPKVGPELRKLAQQEQDLIQQLLGESPSTSYVVTPEHRAWVEQENGLPLERLEGLQPYLNEFMLEQAKIHDAARQARSSLSAADRERLVAIDQAMRAALSEHLTPEELNEYLLRQGVTATQLRFMLGPFRASETEYRSIFPLYQALMDQFPAGVVVYGQRVDSPVDPAQRIAEESLFAQLSATLGPARVEELRIALDPKYSGLNRLVGRLDVPLTSSKQVYEVRQQTEQRAAAIRNDTALSAAERNRQLTTLANEASATIATALGGESGLAAYTETFGDWLTKLATPGG